MRITKKNTVECRYNAVKYNMILHTLPESIYHSFNQKKYIPCFALTVELWDVFCEDLRENWPRYNGTALYGGIFLVIILLVWLMESGSVTPSLLVKRMTTRYDNRLSGTKSSETFFIQTLKISWWRHQMETFPRYWPFLRGIHRSPMDSHHKGQWLEALVSSLICAWTVPSNISLFENDKNSLWGHKEIATKYISKADNCL